jgi:hypothetical protein
MGRRRETQPPRHSHRSAERVGRARLAQGDAPAALQLAEQAISPEELHEPSWRLALQADRALRLRESITRRYDQLARNLNQQL